MPVSWCGNMNPKKGKGTDRDPRALDRLKAGCDETIVFRESTGPVDASEEVPPDVSASTTYQFISLLGRGGMGNVYHAYDRSLQREVAIKVLRSEFQDSPRFVERFIKESLIKAALQHPGVAPLYAMGRFPDGRPYHAMKLLHGKTLDYLLQHHDDDDGRVGLLSAVAQVCQTMAYAHSKGIVHLDLKPSNIMLGDFGRVSVIDWGLACRLGPAHADPGQPNVQSPTIGQMELLEEGSGYISGTPAYMAPEQARGEPLDARADVFSLGAILCEILTGSPVYQGNTPLQLLRRAMRGATSEAMIGLEQSETEQWLRGLVSRCLASDPHDRPADASVLARELSAFQASALKLTESDMVRFFELSPDLFCIAGFDGCFRRVNANFPRTLGYSEQELLSQPFLNFVPEEDKERTIKAMEHLLGGKSVRRFRNHYRTRDGSFLVLEWTAKPVPAEGLIFAVARDVTGEEV